MTKMKHETINSIIGGLGLLIASVTAWFQFAPTDDQLQVVSENRVDLGMPIEVAVGGAIDVETGVPQPVLGPITWKIRVHNETDQVVSIVDWRMFLVTSNGTLAQYSSMRERLSAIDPSLTPLSLPVNISARETTAFFVSAFIPFDREALEQSACFAPGKGLNETERCVLSTGRDFFGNSVSLTRYKSAVPEMFSVTWENQAKTPRFYVKLETADGSEFPVILYYFP
jgi:hypothetical protein